MDIKKLTKDDLDVLTTEINEALAPVAQKHGLKLSCFWEHLQRGGMSAALSIDAEVICPHDCSKQAQAFALYLSKNNLDSQHGLSWEDYGKQFTCYGLTFQIALGTYDNTVFRGSIIVMYNGDLYTVPAAFVADGLRGKAKDAYAEKLSRSMNFQKRLTPVPSAEANHYGTFRKWEWAVNHLTQYSFSTKDYGAEITLHGRQYTIEGFVDDRPYKSVLLMDHNGNAFKAPAYKVAFALGRVSI